MMTILCCLRLLGVVTTQRIVKEIVWLFEINGFKIKYYTTKIQDNIDVLGNIVDNVLNLWENINDERTIIYFFNSLLASYRSSLHVLFHYDRYKISYNKIIIVLLTDDKHIVNITMLSTQYFWSTDDSRSEFTCFYLGNLTVFTSDSSSYLRSKLQCRRRRKHQRLQQRGSNCLCGISR